MFGLGKQQTPPDELPPGEETGDDSPGPRPRGSHRLWAFLLVLDSLFVIVFGGAVAATVYQHWKAPAGPAAAKRRGKEAPKAPEQAKPPEPSKPEPAKEAETAKAPEPAKPEPAKPEPARPEPAKPEPAKPEPAKTETAKAASKPEPAKPAAKEPAKTDDAPRPPKPSLLAEATSPRRTPAPAQMGKSGRHKAQGVEFTLKAPNAQSVMLVGGFLVRGGRTAMEKGPNGVWSVTVYLHPGDYRYFYLVDNRKTLDPENSRSERGASVREVVP